MASARLEVAMLPAFRAKFSYAMAVRGLLGGGLVMVRRMRAFAVAFEKGHVGGSCFRQFGSSLFAWYALMTWDPDEDCGAFPAV